MEEVNRSFVKPPITRWKRSDQTDVQHVSRLITNEVIEYYGEVELHRLIEICSASITLYNQVGEAVAFVAICDYPNVPSVMYSWPQWSLTTYGLNHLNTMNAMFIHLMAFDYRYYPEFFNPIMEKFYMDNEYLDYIALFLPPRSIGYNLLNMYFLRVHKLKDVPPEQMRACFVNNRWIHFGKFVLKESDESVNPIVIKVKKPTNDTSKSKYKKIIIQKDPFRTCIVEETPHAGDCICLNTKVKYNALSEVYDLRPVNGFKSRTRRDYRASSIAGRSAHYFVTGVVESGFKVISKNQIKAETKYSTERISLAVETIEDNLRYEDVVLLETGRVLSSIPYVTRQTSLSDQESKLPIFSTRTPSMFISAQEAGMPSMTYETTITSDAKRREFLGTDNAFAIELMMTYNKKARIIDYMRKIFEFSPRKLNFCLMELPFTSSPPRILNYFHKMNKLDRSHPCDLYVTHMLATTGKMSVREVWPCDMEDIIGMTLDTPYGQSLFDIIYEICFKKNTHLEAFVMLSDNIIIGASVIKQETRIDFLRNNYELDDLMCTSLNRNDEFGQVIHFILSPLFYHYVRFFLKEIMRLTGYTALFLSVFQKKVMETMKSRTWPCGLQRWVPIPQRQLAEQHKTISNKGDVKNTKSHEVKPFSLFFMNRRIASMTLNLDNRDLIVVGHGNTAMSFLENLIYSKNKCYFNFSSIKVISPDSFLYCDEPLFEKDLNDLIPTLNKYSFTYMEKSPIAAYIDQVPGRMTGINREKQLVQVDYNLELHYDYLFLLCGTQFTRPDMKKIVDSETKIKVCSKNHTGKTLEDYYSEDFPMNLCVLDSFSDIDMFIHFIIESYSQFSYEDYLVIYGGRINAWTCLNFLLKYIPGNEIAFVENLNETQNFVDAFDNPLIHEACKNAIINAEVKYYSSYVFSEWETRRQTPVINKVIFTGEKSSLSLKCVAFVTFSPKTIHPITIMALNRSGLEFDGKLVIDHKFRTRDPKIYAAGSMTRYPKQYYFDNLNHEYFNPVEVGAKLAEIFMEEACNEKKVSEPELEVPPLIEMSAPIVVNCVLPRGINYFKIYPPGRVYPFELCLSKGLVGKIMTTGDVSDPQGPQYFRIMLDKFDKVMEVTCFTVRPIDVIGLSRLYGKHEQLLNDLVWRYDNDMILNFYEFFNQPWASIIYHDRFKYFLNDVFPLHEKIMNPGDKEKYLKLAKSLLVNSEKKKNIIRSKMLYILNKNGLDKNLCELLMGFLEFNKDLLPMYLTPSRLKEHAKDNYYMNQLLDPPIFAKNHLEQRNTSTTDVEECISCDSSQYSVDIAGLIFQSTTEEIVLSKSKRRDFHTTPAKHSSDLKTTESIVKMLKMENISVASSSTSTLSSGSKSTINRSDIM